MGYKNTIGKGYLSHVNFCKLLEENIRHIEFDNFGELFCNPDLSAIMKTAYENKVMLSCAGGVNLNNVTDLVLEDLVRYRFQYLNVSIDGASQETYGQYRNGGNFAEVIDHLITINKYKKMYKTPYPKLQWQFIVFGHNEHEILEARQMAEMFGMRFYPKMNWNSSYSPIRDPLLVRKYTGWDVMTREEVLEKTGVSYVRSTCYQLWDNPRLSWDLSVTGCCWNIWERFDEHTLAYAKEDLTNTGSGRINIPQPPCRECGIYQNIRETKTYITKSELLQHTVKSQIATELKYILWSLNR